MSKMFTMREMDALFRLLNTYKVNNLSWVDRKGMHRVRFGNACFIPEAAGGGGLAGSTSRATEVKMSVKGTMKFYG